MRAWIHIAPDQVDHFIDRHKDATVDRMGGMTIIRVNHQVAYTTGAGDPRPAQVRRGIPLRVVAS